MGGEGMIELKDHRLSLAGSRIWLDTESLEKLSRNVVNIGLTRHGSSPDDVLALGRELLDLYGGDFLAGDEEPWTDRCRRLQRKRFITAAETLCAVLGEAGKSGEAAGIFQAALQKGIPREEFSLS
jgi:two-component SAPR family response regulator